MNRTTIIKLQSVIFVIWLYCVPVINGIQFNIQVPGQQTSCFYQVLGQSQKYAIQLIPSTQSIYQLQISHSQDNIWKNVYHKLVQTRYQRINLHKLAISSTTYSFCIKNNQQNPLKINIKFYTGIQLMQFQFLPDKSDTQNIDREISWIQNEKKGLYDTIRQVQQRKTNNINASSLLSVKMIIFAILGLVGIVVVNFLFFKEVKKTFKQRKII